MKIAQLQYKNKSSTTKILNSLPLFNIIFLQVSSEPLDSNAHEMFQVSKWKESTF